MELKDDERIDDLQFKNLKIIQNTKEFRFGIDAVLLSDFAKGIKAKSTVIDLCSGTGIVAILLAGKTNAKKNNCGRNSRKNGRDVKKKC